MRASDARTPIAARARATCTLRETASTQPGTRRRNTATHRTTPTPTTATPSNTPLHTRPNSTTHPVARGKAARAAATLSALTVVHSEPAAGHPRSRTSRLEPLPTIAIRTIFARHLFILCGAAPADGILERGAKIVSVIVEPIYLTISANIRLPLTRTHGQHRERCLQRPYRRPLPAEQPCRFQGRRRYRKCTRYAVGERRPRYRPACLGHGRTQTSPHGLLAHPLHIAVLLAGACR